MNIAETPIPEPCPARWESMDGTDRQRFCRGCHQTVYDLSAMGEEEARAFVGGNPGACLRYTYDGRTGLILHRSAGCQTARVRIATRRAGALALLALALSGPVYAVAATGADYHGLYGRVRDRIASYAHRCAIWFGFVAEPSSAEPEGAPGPVVVQQQRLPEVPTEVYEMTVLGR